MSEQIYKDIKERFKGVTGDKLGDFCSTLTAEEWDAWIQHESSVSAPFVRWARNKYDKSYKGAEVPFPKNATVK